jgi:zinc transport system substrate-binding protein
VRFEGLWWPWRRHGALALAVTASVALVVPLAGTGSAASSARAPKRISVVAAFYPLAEVAQQVGGRYVTVHNLTPAGAEPHDLELNSDQVDETLGAALVIVMGKGFQPAVEAAAKQRDGTTVSVLSRLTAVKSKGKHVAPAGAVTPNALDPHVWLDPVLMRNVVVIVRDALVKADPRHAATYRVNAARYAAEVARLDADYRSGLATCTRKLIVTSHEAFGYLAKEYGLRQVGITGIDPEAEPDPQHLAELTKLAKQKGVTTIFTESLVSPKVAQTLAREAGGLRTEVLNPLEGLTDRQVSQGESYLSVMHANLAKLRTALGCT